MVRVLIVSPASTDIVLTGRTARVRPGGPALYAGAAASLMGHEAYAYGGWGYENDCTVKAEEMAGVVRLGERSAGGGAVFVLDYRGGERRVVLAGRPPSVCAGVLAAYRRVDPDLVLVSPLYGDVCPGILPMLRAGALVAVDVQGYHRAGMKGQLLPGSADVIHGSGEEARGLHRSAAPIIVETNGYGPVALSLRGVRVTVLERPPGPRLRDPTGAGDVFTLLLAIHLHRGEPPLEAARLAAGGVPSLLRKVHSIALERGCAQV